jgi:HlyD family secretion protein
LKNEAVTMLSKAVQRRVALGVLGVLLLGGIGWVMVRNGPLAPVKVTVAPVQTGVLQPAVMGIGTVEARRSWVIAPTAAGRVLKVYVDVGDAVQAGQLVAEMEPVDLDERLHALDASLGRARSAQLAAQAQVQDAQARQSLARSNLQRNEDLARQQFISAGALEGRQQELASATAALQAAQANVQAAAQDTQRLGAERAALAQQRSNVRLLAPAAAVVSSRDAEAGTTLVAGQAVLRLIDPSSLWVKTRVDQARSSGLAVGQAAQVVLRSHVDTPIAATVARLEPLADAVTEERLVQIALTQPPASLAVGEMAEVTVQLPPTSSGWIVPNAALQRHQGDVGVWRLNAAHAPEWLPVRVLIGSLDGRVRVEAQGLNEGDRLITHSQKPMQAGLRVQVVDALLLAPSSAGKGQP